MTIDPKVKEALLNHDRAVVAYATRTAREVTGPFLADCDKTRDALLSAVRTAHLQELVGETFPEDAASEAEFAECEADSFGWDGYHTEDAVAHARMFRRQRNTLRAKLQAQEARIKELEEATKELRQGCGRYYITQETAFSPGIVKEWPKVIKHPKDRNGRLVMRIFPGTENPIEEA